MSRLEFINLNGVAAWRDMVRPKQLSDHPHNANHIVHHNVIMPVLKLLGYPQASGLLEAKKLIDSGHPRCLNTDCDNQGRHIF